MMYNVIRVYVCEYTVRDKYGDAGLEESESSSSGDEEEDENAEVMHS